MLCRRPEESERIAAGALKSPPARRTPAPPWPGSMPSESALLES